ncbi:cation efflux protein [Xylariales sp. AK1849]|nr:cation efflux protein [Xylariales sp. AK1849]
MGLTKSTRISIMLGICTVFFFTELIAGMISGSLALMADAFHMLNDIISLIVGLWAVTISKRQSTDKFSYGWLRAEILGGFFNAVFLIALCVSIIIESITRFVTPPEVDNPKLILIVGCCGLASNLLGFVVLGGHDHGHGDHSHGGESEQGHEHVHDHGEAAAAEEGRAGRNIATFTDESSPAFEALPQFAVTRAGAEGNSPETVRHIHFDSSEGGQRSEHVERSASRSSAARGRERRRTGSLKHNRLSSIDDNSFHPASFRQNIIDHSRSNVGDTDGSSTEGDPAVDENTPLITNANGSSNGNPKDRSIPRKPRFRRDSGVHNEHHHNKPRKPSKKGGGHGHSHGDMGMNAMVLHVLGDAFGNVGVIITALIIWLSDWPGKFYADPAVSLLITGIILKSALPLTFASAKVLLQATPDNIDIQDIKDDIQALDGVMSCHHVHVWRLSDTRIVASMHVQVAFPITEEGGEKYMVLAKQARKCLHAYGIHSATIQPEFCLDHDHYNGQVDGQVDGTHGVCLLECTDDCKEQGCCPTDLPTQNGDGSGESSHSGHDHGHDHSHDHH